jgi:hypothetical protein
VDGRGDLQGFEPSPEILTPITGLLLGPVEPRLIIVERLMQRSA